MIDDNPIEESAAEAAATLTMLAKRLEPSIIIGCRVIGRGDAEHLTQAERASMRGAVDAVRNASGAARFVARSLLYTAGGLDPVDLVSRRPDGPLWPKGWLGTLAHDEVFAVAAISPIDRLRGLGVDVEPAERLPEDIYDVVVTSSEHAQIRGDRLLARLLFVIKEAIYKATHPWDGVFLEPHDIVVDLAAEQARTRTGHHVSFAATHSPRLFALAVLRLLPPTAHYLDGAAHASARAAPG